MKVDLYNQQGKKTTKQVELPDSIFATTVNTSLLAQYTYIYLSNQRESIAHVKDRSEVSGGGRKPWRQKGTGRARAGSNRSPIWVGGGVTFGPSNERNWKRSMPRKMRIGALRSAFSQLMEQGKIKVVEKMSFDEKQLTKQATAFVDAFGKPNKMTIVAGEQNKEVLKGFANIKNAKVLNVGELNAYAVLNAGELLLSQDALEVIGQWA